MEKSSNFQRMYSQNKQANNLLTNEGMKWLSSIRWKNLICLELSIYEMSR